MGIHTQAGAALRNLCSCEVAGSRQGQATFIGAVAQNAFPVTATLWADGVAVATAVLSSSDVLAGTVGDVTGDADALVALHGGTAPALDNHFMVVLNCRAGVDRVDLTSDTDQAGVIPPVRASVIV